MVWNEILPVTVKRHFRQEFGCHPSHAPSNTEIHQVNHFRKEGSVHRQMKRRSGPPSVIRPSVGQPLTVLTSNRWIFGFEGPARRMYIGPSLVPWKSCVSMWSSTSRKCQRTPHGEGGSQLSRACPDVPAAWRCPLRAHSGIKNVQILFFNGVENSMFLKIWL